MSAILKERVRFAPYLKKLRTAEECLPLFKNGQYLGWSGFTGVGSPKAVPTALADYVEKNNLQGQLSFNLFVGASAGPEESRWADLGMLHRRAPHQVGRPIRNSINAGKTMFQDKHLSMFPQDLTYGYYTREKENDLLDVVLIEATAITEDGSIVPGPAVGGSPEFLSVADKIIIEVNTALPSFEGLHDIDIPVAPPHRQPLPYTTVDQRNGLTAIPVDPSRVVAIVESTHADNVPEPTPPDALSKRIASHLVEFLEQEVKAGRMPENLHPIQSGIGNVGNAIVDGLADSNFKHMTVWTEVMQDAFLKFFEEGKIDFATSTSIRLSPKGFKQFFDNWDMFSKKIVLRSQTVSNHPEMIRRLGVIALNTPVEFDMYGHANSTCVSGSKILNGLGGSADFLRNAKLSIMHTPSARKTKTDPTGLSCVVPMCSHIDQTEHDVDCYVTEQGLADLRGLSPRERVPEIIKQCVHPDYKAQLQDYFDRAVFYCTKNKSLHEPQILADAFKMYQSLEKNGTMKLKSWDEKF